MAGTVGGAPRGRHLPCTARQVLSPPRAQGEEAGRSRCVRNGPPGKGSVHSFVVGLKILDPGLVLIPLFHLVELIGEDRAL